mgnify:CR=1 FL=1
MRELLRMYKFNTAASLLVAGAATGNEKYFYWIPAAYSASLASVAAKYMYKGLPGWKRPPGACNCSSFPRWDKGVSAMGMPSGHAWGSAFLATSAVYHMHRNKKRKSLMAIPIVAALLIVLSRTTVLGSWSGGGLGESRVACHTPLQLMAGVILGIVHAIVFIQVKEIHNILY